ncbi:hypothetical protein [Chitinibacter sp. S2-10]|uniref:hypothetical protein n=1 Tax=Chitinibacter sp. S2-10 TaxID=3373597 RepID=UPI0039772B7E
MKKAIVLTAALLTALALPSYAAPTQQVAMVSKPGSVALAEIITANASISAIDAAKKTVTLKNAEGKTLDVQASEKVKNFDKLKVGDKVSVEYLQHLQVELLKTGSKVKKVIVETQVASGTAAKPAKAIAAQTTVVGNVEKVDAKANTITVKGVDNTLVLNVRDPEQFKLIKKGDQIKATYTEAVAVGVTLLK